MARVLGLLLALLLAVTPAAGVVCRAACTPTPSPDARAPCHEALPPTGDGMIETAVSCQRDAVDALVPADASRTIVAPPHVVSLPATLDAPGDALLSSAARAHSAVRPRPTQAFPSSIVLRI